MSEPALKLTENLQPQSNPAKVYLRNKYVIIILAMTISLAVLTLSYKWFIYSRYHIETNNAYIEGDVFPIQARMMGQIKSVFFEEGQVCRTGDVLIKLDDTDVLVEKGFKQARFKKASIDFNRAKQLLNDKLISQSDYELAEAAFIGASADLRGSELKLKYTEIIALQDGMIAKLYVKPGQFIQPGQNLMTLVSQSRFWIKANYKETQIEKISPGQNVDIEIDAYPGVRFFGKVFGIFPSSGSVLSILPPENATGNFTKIVQRVPVKILIRKNIGYTLRPGMSVQTSIDTTIDTTTDDKKYIGEK